ncbi:MAG: serine hydrolase, partial [bacterium]
GRLVEEEKLNWDDKVIDYMPEFRLADPYITKELNMKDILSHRSGLATFYGDLLWYETNYDNQEIIKRMRYLPIKNDFRSEFGYQNNMFMIAGEIIYKITGQTWSEFVYEKLFQPLEMVESKTCSQDLTKNQDIAHPHIKGKLSELPIYRPNPAGTIFSSVDEMSHWIIMLLNGGRWQGQQILNTNTIEELFSAQTILNVSSFMKKNGSHFHAYGLGWFLFDYAGKKIVEHDGGMPGYISKVTLVPEEKLGLVILTNDLNNLTGALRYKILDTFLTGRQKDWAKEYLQYKKAREKRLEKQKSERAAKRAKNTTPSLELAGYTGTYQDKMYGNAKVEIKNNELWLTLLPTKEKFVSKMEHWHYDTFRIKFKDEFLPEGFVTFSFNSNGEVTGFKIDLPNPDFHFFNLDFKKINNKKH